MVPRNIRVLQKQGRVQRQAKGVGNCVYDSIVHVLEAAVYYALWKTQIDKRKTVREKEMAEAFDVVLGLSTHNIQQVFETRKRRRKKAAADTDYDDDANANPEEDAVNQEEEEEEEEEEDPSGDEI